MADILRFPGITKLDTDPELVLEGALGELSEVVIIGITKGGEEYFASSQASGPEVLWHLERAKKRLLQIVEDME